MFRFVNSPKGQWTVSWTLSGLSFVAVMFFGAPPATIFFALVVTVAVTIFAEWMNERDERRRRRPR